MRRRDFMKGALAATVAPAVMGAQTSSPVIPKTGTIAPGPLPWMQGLDHGELPPVRTIDIDGIAQPSEYFFTSTQTATLVRLSEVLVPALNGYPGAIEAQTPAFIDFFVGKSSPEIQRLYRNGLDGLDAEAKTKHGRSFAALDTAQVDAMVKPRLATWMPDHYPTPTEERFVTVAHHDIRMATLNSPAWAIAARNGGKIPTQGEIYWSPVEPDIYRN